jgi:enoyl-CoA hydratase
VLSQWKANSDSGYSILGDQMHDVTGPDNELIVERKGYAGIIRLNRPRALNSVNLTMVHHMKEALAKFADDPAIASVIVAGEGGRAFCAGGDIRIIHDLGRANDPDVSRFWREEFPLNYTIAHYPKPYIALMDGIVMGGGVGLSAHGAFRVVTETTRLAMPETGIGYFPDVGISWLLPKAPGEIGTWMGLTGQDINAADAILAGLADVHIPSGKLAELVDGISHVGPGDAQVEIQDVLSRFATQATPGVLDKAPPIIDVAFRYDTVEEIAADLASRADDFAQATLQTLQKRSPTSLKITLRLLRLARDSSGLIECLEREFAAGLEVLKGHDFYEGVRAAIIDKDRNPQWQPAKLRDVTNEDIARYFEQNPHPIFASHRL